jgi:hypothetical protein
MRRKSWRMGRRLTSSVEKGGGKEGNGENVKFEHVLGVI